MPGQLAGGCAANPALVTLSSGTVSRAVRGAVSAVTSDTADTKCIAAAVAKGNITRGVTAQRFVDGPRRALADEGRATTLRAIYATVLEALLQGAPAQLIPVHVKLPGATCRVW